MRRTIKPTRLALYLLVSMAFCVGCSSGNEIRGTAVIEGEYSRRFVPEKMSVKIIDEKEMQEFIKKKSVSIKSSIDSLDGQRGAIRENLDKIGNDVSEGRQMIASGNGILAGIEGRIARANSVPCERDPFTDEEDCSAKQAAIGAARAAEPKGRGLVAAGSQKVAGGQAMLGQQNQTLLGVEKSMTDNFTSKILTENLPNPLATAVVDGDGEFVIELPKGRYALVASGNKNDLGIEEELFWMFWIDVSGEGVTRIKLTKDNLLVTDHENNIIKMKDFLEKSSERQ